MNEFKKIRSDDFATYYNLGRIKAKVLNETSHSVLKKALEIENFYRTRTLTSYHKGLPYGIKRLNLAVPYLDAFMNFSEIELFSSTLYFNNTVLFSCDSIILRITSLEDLRELKPFMGYLR